MAMVVRANEDGPELGGHIATFASSATLYEVGFNHFFRAPGPDGGDLIYIQGHASPGIYARAFLEGRLTEEQLNLFRQETGGGGLSSYPHPWLMPDFWQFPTVSMGLGPIMAIYQARFLSTWSTAAWPRRPAARSGASWATARRDEPESLGAIALAGRERLDNLIFVINCNLQRLDGPVRGNGKIIQELEAAFRGAGWNVHQGHLGQRLGPAARARQDRPAGQAHGRVVDGEFQNFTSKDGAYVREHFFGKYPELLELVADMTDDQIWALKRGGHDPEKVYAAYQAAVRHTGPPTVILAKTVKGYGLGEAGEGQNITHQQKKMARSSLARVPQPLRPAVPDEQLAEVPFLPLRPRTVEEMQYLREAPRRWAATCRPRGSGPRTRWRCPASDVRRPARAARGAGRSPPRWRFVRHPRPRCCATRRSASTSCRSCPTRPAPSAWRACSASSASSARSASSTSRWTPTS